VHCFLPSVGVRCGQVHHGSATTTAVVRRAIEHRKETLRALATQYGFKPGTVAKRKKRSSTVDLPSGPKEQHSPALAFFEEAIIVAFRNHSLLPLDDCPMRFNRQSRT